MGNRGRIVLGILSFWPTVYLALWHLVGLLVLLGAWEMPPAGPLSMWLRVQDAALIPAWTVPLTIGVVGWSLRNVFRNPRVAREDRKAAWSITLLFGWPVALPVYWYRNIWHVDAGEPAPSGGSAKRSRFLRLVLGMATLWPIVHTTVLVVLEESGVVTRIELQDAEGQLFYGLGAYLMVVCTLGPLMTVFVCDVFTNERFATDAKRGSWALTLFLGHIIVMPVYWYLYMWRRPKGVRNPT